MGTLFVITFLMNFFKSLSALSLVLCSLIAIQHVFAAGNIDSISKYAQFLNVDLNTDIINDRINWNPTNAGATVTNSQIVGTVWGETMGWINLQPTNGGVTNTCSGVVGGTAWGQNTGWINFSPTNGGVSISPSTGEFSGWAWAQNYGWIKFNCADGSNSCVKTTWAGCSIPPGGGGGGAGLDLCSNIDGIQGTIPAGYVKTPPELTVTGICTLKCDASGKAQCNNDICPNISGDQTVVPTGYFMDTDGFCKIDACPNLPGNQSTNAQCPGQVTDVCPNIPGNQTTIPDGYIINNSGNCVKPVTPPEVNDLCPNLPGNQIVLPAGYSINSQGNCVKPVIPPEIIDVCPNISGNQSSVPSGYVLDIAGNCIIPKNPPNDACPNLDGSQITIPFWYTLDSSGNCIITNPDDFCPNIPGNQGNIPAGYTVNSNGDCIMRSFDACPEIPGDQPTGTKCSVKGDIRTTTSGTVLSGNFLKKIAPIIGLVGLAGTLPGIGLRIGNLILAIPFRRRRRPWGIVYDAKTKEPLDPVYVTVYDAETGKVVDTKITDIHGRYAFLLPVGNYRMTAQKTHYQFPSTTIPQSHSDGVYDDLYFGEVFSITNDHRDAVVTLNIPMDRLETDWNQEEKRRMGIIDWFTRNTKLWSAISLFLFILGFVFSIYALIVAPVIWNKVVFVLYVVFAILQLIGFGSVKTGTITDQSGKGIPFAVVRVWNAHLKTQIAQRITDRNGNYYILVTKGDYYITIDVKNSTDGYDRVLTSENIHVKKGIINKSFQV